MSVPALRLVPRLTVIEGGYRDRAELEELRMELATSNAERLSHTDGMRDLLRLAMTAHAVGGPVGTMLARLDRRNEREALRVRSMDVGCKCGPAA